MSITRAVRITAGSPEVKDEIRTAVLPIANVVSETDVSLEVSPVYERDIATFLEVAAQFNAASPPVTAEEV